MKTVLATGALALLILLPACGPRSEEVHFTNMDLTLSGTLLLPDSEGPVPAVVLIHGSGEADRESMRYYAKLFVRNGYAALIYDKRGVGKSEGSADSWRRFNFDELAGDAAAAVRYLAERDDVDADRIGLFGASQGAWVAPLAAVKSGRVAFMVELSASVCTVAEDRLFERAARLKIEGFSDAEIREVAEMQRVDQELTRNGQGFEQFAALWDQHKDKRWFRRVYLGDEPTAANDEWRLWYRTILDYDPVHLLEQLSIPALWLFGDPAHDRFGPVQASVEQLEQLKQSGKEYEIAVFQGADHNLRMVEGGGEAPFKAALSQWLSTSSTTLSSHGAGGN